MNITNSLNFAQCIKEAHSIGANWFTNICTGDVTKVAWGSLDWAHYIFSTTVLALVVSVIVLAFVGMTITLNKEIK